MLRIHASLDLYGKRFDPHQLGRQFEDRLRHVIQIGTLSKLGNPSNHGSCHIEIICNSSDPNEYINYALKDIEYLFKYKKNLGIESISLWLYIYYISQCNLEFNPKHLKKLGNLSVPLLIDCYEDNKRNKLSK